MDSATSCGPSATRDESGVVDRKFDLGTIVRLENDGRVSAIILDRWTADGVADSRGQAAKAQNDPAC